MTHFIEENGNIYRLDSMSDHEVTTLLGGITKTEVVRIDAETVTDITYQFDLESGKYVEQSRTERAEPLPAPEPTPEQEIAQLKTENLSLKLAITELAATAEQDKIEMQLALAELAAMITEV